MDAEFKPLYALLRRYNITDYLVSSEFENTLIELDLDCDWRDLDQEFELSVGKTRGKYPEAFFELMMSLVVYSSTGGHNKFIRLLNSFLSWSPENIDYGKVQKELKTVEIDGDALKLFNKHIKGLNERVSIKAKVIADTPNTSRDPKKVFIIHGHDEVALLELDKLLRDELKLRPVILKDQPSVGWSTIISKFEREVETCGIVIALFTPDDLTVNNTQRARQNVVFELGYVLGRDYGKQNRRIIVIKRGNVEIPSDISGVLYYEYQKSVSELYLNLKKEIESWGPMS